MNRTQRSTRPICILREKRKNWHCETDSGFASKLASGHNIRGYCPIPEDQSMDIDSTLDQYDSSTMSSMDQDWQIPKVELNQSNENSSASKRFVQLRCHCFFFVLSVALRVQQRCLELSQRSFLCACAFHPFLFSLRWLSSNTNKNYFEALDSE